MAKVKNVSGEDRVLFERLVLAGAVIEVDDDQVYSLTQQELWEPADKAAKDAHAAGEAAYQGRVNPAPEGEALSADATTDDSQEG